MTFEFVIFSSRVDFLKEALREIAPAGWRGAEDKEEALGLLSSRSRGRSLRCPRQSCLLSEPPGVRQGLQEGRSRQRLCGDGHMPCDPGLTGQELGAPPASVGSELR